MVIVGWLSADEAEEDGRTGSGRRGGCGSGVARISHEELRGPVGGEGGDAARCSAIALTGATKHSNATFEGVRMRRLAGAPGEGPCSQPRSAQLRRADPARQAQPQLQAPARRRVARDLARKKKELRQRRARAHFAARRDAGGGAARAGDGSCWATSGRPCKPSTTSRCCSLP